MTYTDNTEIMLPLAETGMELEGEKGAPTLLFHSICEPACVALLMLG